MTLATASSRSWKTHHGLDSSTPAEHGAQLDNNSPSYALRTSNSGFRTPRNEIQGDRFIPIRSAMDLDIAHFNLSRDAKENTKSKMEVASPLKEEYKRKLARRLFHDCEAMVSPKILAFKARAALPSSTKHYSAPELRSLEEDTPEAMFQSPTKFYRRISPVPERVLDAPELVDDYYLNLLDWSCKNVVAVALGTTVYLWHADTGAIHQLMSTYAEDDCVTSVAWAPDGEHIALGFNNKEIQLWDATRYFQVRKLKVHSARVGSLAWNGSMLSSGSRDSKILNHDVRIRDHLISQFSGHSQEVCGLKWAPSGQQLASGGNDNLLHIWDVSVMSSSGMSSTSHPSTPYLHRLDEHQAAVKALAWCPFQLNLLASGGGTADRCIKFWNTHTGSCIDSVDTHSQVCALQWSQHQKEILSSHGFSQNQLCIWKYPSMSKLAELTGHTARVLHLAQSPDGTSVVSAAADETLRFWKAKRKACHKRNLSVHSRRQLGSGGKAEDVLVSLVRCRKVEMSLECSFLSISARGFHTNIPKCLTDMLMLRTQQIGHPASLKLQYEFDNPIFLVSVKLIVKPCNHSRSQTHRPVWENCVETSIHCEISLANVLLELIKDF